MQWRSSRATGGDWTSGSWLWVVHRRRLPCLAGDVDPTDDGTVVESREEAVVPGVWVLDELLSRRWDLRRLTMQCPLPYRRPQLTAESSQQLTGTCCCVRGPDTWMNPPYRG